MEYLYGAVRIFPEAGENDTMRQQLAQLGGAAELLTIGTAVIIEDA